MKLSKNTKIIVLLVIIVLILIGVIAIMLSPLRKPVKSIEKDILKLIPLGTSLEDAVKVFEKKHNWKIGHKSEGRRSWSLSDSEFVLENPSAGTLGFVLSDFAFEITDVIFTFKDYDGNIILTNIEVRRYFNP